MASAWKKNYGRYKRFFLRNADNYRKRQDLKAYLEVFLSLATIIIFAVFALRPTLLAIAKLIKEIEVREETIKTMDSKIQNLAKAQDLYSRQKDNIQLLETSIPKNPLPDAFVRQIEGISLEQAVSVTSMSIGETTLLGESDQKTADDKELAPLPKEVEGMPFSVSVTADYQSLINFLSSVESLRRPVKIDSVSLSSSLTDEGKILILFFNGRSPFLRDDGQNTANNLSRQKNEKD